MTYQEFVKKHMPAAMKKAGNAPAAMKAVAKKWKTYKSKSYKKPVTKRRVKRNPTAKRGVKRNSTTVRQAVKKAVAKENPQLRPEKGNIYIVSLPSESGVLISRYKGNGKWNVHWYFTSQNSAVDWAQKNVVLVNTRVFEAKAEEMPKSFWK